MNNAGARPSQVKKDFKKWNNEQNNKHEQNNENKTKQIRLDSNDFGFICAGESLLRGLE